MKVGLHVIHCQGDGEWSGLHYIALHCKEGAETIVATRCNTICEDMKPIIPLLLCALFLSLITISILISQISQSGDNASYVKHFSHEHLRREQLMDEEMEVNKVNERIITSIPSVSDLDGSLFQEEPKSRAVLSARKPTHRIAMMVIYVGNSLPSWFRTFLLSVEGSGDIIKWLIFVTEALQLDDRFENIEIIQITRQELYERLTRLDPFSGAIKLMDNLITHAPYSLVEFKPCLATIFEVLVFLHLD